MLSEKNDFSNWAPHNPAFVMSESDNEPISLRFHVMRIADTNFDVLWLSLSLYRFYCAENVKVLTENSRTNMFGIMQPEHVCSGNGGVALICERIREYRIDKKEVKIGRDVTIS